jgi:hypothetical protein
MMLSTRARVSGATSGRPLRTFETVGMDTPASAAMDEIDAAPFTVFSGTAPAASRSVDELMLPPVRVAVRAPHRI